MAFMDMEWYGKRHARPGRNRKDITRNMLETFGETPFSMCLKKAFITLHHYIITVPR